MKKSLALIFSGRLNLCIQLAFVMLLYLCWHVMWRPSAFPIRRVKVIGTYHHLDPHQLQQIAMPPLNRGFFAVDAKQLRQRLLLVPWLQTVSVRRLWPETIVLHFTEQKAIARWNDRGLLNAQGDTFYPAPDTIDVKLPQLSGAKGYETQVFQQYQKMCTMVASIGRRITYLRLTERSSWQMRLDNGMEVMLGAAEPISRFHYFTKVYARVFGAKANQVSKVDLRYPSGMAVTWKNA